MQFKKTVCQVLILSLFVNQFSALAFARSQDEVIQSFRKFLVGLQEHHRREALAGQAVTPNPVPLTTSIVQSNEPHLIPIQPTAVQPTPAPAESPLGVIALEPILIPINPIAPQPESGPTSKPESVSIPIQVIQQLPEIDLEQLAGAFSERLALMDPKDFDQVDRFLELAEKIGIPNLIETMQDPRFSDMYNLAIEKQRVDQTRAVSGYNCCWSWGGPLIVTLLVGDVAGLIPSLGISLTHLKKWGCTVGEKIDYACDRGDGTYFKPDSDYPAQCHGFRYTRAKGYCYNPDTGFVYGPADFIWQHGPKVRYTTIAVTSFLFLAIVVSTFIYLKWFTCGAREYRKGKKTLKRYKNLTEDLSQKLGVTEGEVQETFCRVIPQRAYE